jgi:hypothetical protein
LRTDEQGRNELLTIGAEADRVGDAEAIALLLQPHHRLRIDREHAGDVLDDARHRARVAIEIRARVRRQAKRGHRLSGARGECAERRAEDRANDLVLTRVEDRLLPELFGETTRRRREVTRAEAFIEETLFF